MSSRKPLTSEHVTFAMVRPAAAASCCCSSSAAVGAGARAAIEHALQRSVPASSTTAPSTRRPPAATARPARRPFGDALRAARAPQRTTRRSADRLSCREDDRRGGMPGGGSPARRLPRSRPSARRSPHMLQRRTRRATSSQLFHTCRNSMPCRPTRGRARRVAVRQDYAEVRLIAHTSAGAPAVRRLGHAADLEEEAGVCRPRHGVLDRWEQPLASACRCRCTRAVARPAIAEGRRRKAGTAWYPALGLGCAGRPQWRARASPPVNRCGRGKSDNAARPHKLHAEREVNDARRYRGDAAPGLLRK